MHELDGQRWKPSRGEQRVLPADAGLGGLQVDLAFGTCGRRCVEGDLRVIERLGKVLEGEQADRLLVELVHRSATILGGRLEHRGECAAYCGGLTDLAHQHPEHEGGGMGGDHRRRLQVQHLGSVGKPGSQHDCILLRIERTGQIHDG